MGVWRHRAGVLERGPDQRSHLREEMTYSACRLSEHGKGVSAPGAENGSQHGALGHRPEETKRNQQQPARQTGEESQGRKCFEKEGETSCSLLLEDWGGAGGGRLSSRVRGEVAPPALPWSGEKGLDGFCQGVVVERDRAGWGAAAAGVWVGRAELLAGGSRRKARSWLPVLLGRVSFTSLDAWGELRAT